MSFGPYGGLAYGENQLGTGSGGINAAVVAPFTSTTVLRISGVARETLANFATTLQISGVVREVLRTTSNTGVTQILISGIVREVLLADANNQSSSWVIT